VAVASASPRNARRGAIPWQWMVALDRLHQPSGQGEAASAYPCPGEGDQRLLEGEQPSCGVAAVASAAQVAGAGLEVESIQQQRILHSGDELQAKNRHDLAQLDALQQGSAA
jgi:hypothetical protein